MNPPTFYGSKVEEHTHDLFHQIYKVFYAMGLTTSEKYELATN